MAVRALNPLEQHAGKIFLGVVLLICAVLVWLYVIGDPVGVEIDGRTISVDAARRELEDAARRISAQTEKTDPKTGKPTPLRDPKNDPPVAHSFVPPTIRFGEPGGLAEQIISPIGSLWLTGGSEDKRALVMLNAQPNLLAAPPKPLLERDRRTVTIKGQGTVESNVVSISSIIPPESQKFIADLQNQAASAGRPWPVANRTALLVVAVDAERRLLDENGNPVGPATKVSPPFDMVPERVAKANPPPAGNATVTQWIDWGTQVQAWCDKNIAPADRQEKLRRPALADGVTPPKVNKYEPPATEPENPGPPIPPAGQPEGAAPAPAPAPGVAGAAPAVAGASDPIFWTMDGKVESGKQYIYRVRYVVFNPLVGKRMLVQDQDRNTLVFASDWSPWSDPIQIEQDLFLFAKDVSYGVPEFYIYRQTTGWLFRQTFHAQIGEMLGGKAPVRRGAGKPEEVDFSTHLLVVDIRQGDTLVKRPGVNGNIELVPMASTQVVLQNEAGQLFVRSIEAGKADPRAKEKEAEYDNQVRGGVR